MPALLFPKYAPHAHQARVHRSGKRWLVVIAGSRGGKTLACAKETLTRIFRDLNEGRCNDVASTGNKDRLPRHHTWICAPFASLLDPPKQRVFELLDGTGLIESWDRSVGKLWLHGGALIEYKTTENRRALVGSGLHGLWVDEADRIADHDVWHGQLAMRLRDHQGWAIFSSTPEQARAGFLFHEFISKAATRDDIGLVTWKTAQNPYMKVSEIEHARATTPPKYFAREWEASLDAFVGLVFNLKHEHHVRSETEFRFQYGLGNRDFRDCFEKIGTFVDWGWSDLGIFLTVGDLGGHTLVALNEVAASHKPIIDPTGSKNSWAYEAEQLRAKYGVRGPGGGLSHGFYYDPSQPGYAHQLSLQGFSFHAANNRIQDGIRRIDEAMMVRRDGRAGLIIIDRCTNLIREMENLQYAKNKDGSSTEEPEDKNNHGVDCLRYAALEYRSWKTFQDANVTRRPQPASTRLGY